MVRESLTERLAALKEVATIERLDGAGDAAPESDAATTSGDGK